MSGYIINIKDSSAEDIAVSGGKGANLARLSGIFGIHVPDGFIVTAQAYGDIILSQPEIRALLSRLAGITFENSLEIADLSKQIREEIEKNILSADFIQAISGALLSCGDMHAYAVRSSATAEDLPGASFAGQQDTYLNITGIQNICEAIIKCWASLFNERAVAYRIKNGFSHDRALIAVVVQKMVDSEVSGVLFTADPMTSDRFTTIIEAVRGLGEELVSGRKKPFTWKLRDGKLQETGKGEGEAPLDKTLLLELAKTCKRIEAAFGCEQDIEWCYAKSMFSIVQARPITTLYPTPPSLDGFKRCAVSNGHWQMMTDPVLPLGLSLLAKSRFYNFAPLGGRMYTDVTHDLGMFKGRRAILAESGIKDPLMRSILDEILKRKSYIKSVPKGHSGMISLEGKWSIAWRALNAYLNGGSESDIDAYVVRQKAAIETARCKLEKLSGADALRYILDDQHNLRVTVSDPHGAGTTMTAMLAGLMLDKAAEKLVGEKNVSNRLSKSVKYNVTSEMGLKLCEVSDIAREYSEVVSYLEKAGEDFSLDELEKVDGGSQVAAVLREFLSEYGMRCTGEIDVTRERFRERPCVLLASLLNNIKNLPSGHAAVSFEQGKYEAQTLADELVAKMEEAHGRRRAKKLRRQIDIYRRFIGVREYTKYFWMGFYDVYKQALMREAQRLEENNILKQKDDVYYLSLEELIDVLKNEYAEQSLIEERKNAYRLYSTLTPPRVIFSDGEVPVAEYSADVPNGALAGLAVSLGIVEGRARVVEKIEDAHIEKGDILVTTFTDPSWTPVFVSISGLVTEIGGMMSHGAVITREYGLPAVVGVVNATKQIKDGQRIRLNGTKGYVELL